MWLGEEITAKGVGNGISIIIFGGIVAGIPNAVNQIYAQQFEGAGRAAFLAHYRYVACSSGHGSDYCWCRFRPAGVA